MKRIIVGVALVGMAFGCRSDKNTSVSDPAAANMPKSECCAGKADPSKCADADKAACEKKSCCTKTEAQTPPQN
jgi:hypothetical protein